MILVLCPTVFKSQFKIWPPWETYRILFREKQEKDARSDMKAFFPNGQHHLNKQTAQGSPSCS